VVDNGVARPCAAGAQGRRQNSDQRTQHQHVGSHWCTKATPSRCGPFEQTLTDVKQCSNPKRCLSFVVGRSPLALDAAMNCVGAEWSENDSEITSRPAREFGAEKVQAPSRPN